MTLEAFIEHLRATRTTRRWVVEQCDAYGKRLRTSVYPGSANATCECPVTAVAHHLGITRTFDRPFSAGLYGQAADAMGLDMVLANKLAAAADDSPGRCTFVGEKYSTTPSPLFAPGEFDVLREWLVEAVGVEVPS